MHTSLMPLAEASGGNLNNAEAGALLGAGLLVVGIVVLLYFVIQAVFLHIAASLLSLRGGFGAAFKATLIAFVVGIGFGIIMTFAAPGAAQGASLLVNLIAGAIGVSTSYQCGIVKGFITYLLAMIVSVALAIGIGLLLIGLFAAGAAA